MNLELVIMIKDVFFENLISRHQLLIVVYLEEINLQNLFVKLSVIRIIDGDNS